MGDQSEGEQIMTIHYVDQQGVYVGGFGDGAVPEDLTLINLGDNPPDYADQVWLFPGWSDSPGQAVAREGQWRETETLAIAAQLEALEEAAEGKPPAGIFPGTRAQWLEYRGQVRNWADGAEHYPDPARRPVRPT